MTGLEDLKKQFPNIDFSQPLAQQMDSINTVTFIIKIEKVFNKKIDLLSFDTKNSSLRKALSQSLGVEL